jgi:hypothetical protein
MKNNVRNKDNYSINVVECESNCSSSVSFLLTCLIIFKIKSCEGGIFHHESKRLS